MAHYSQNSYDSSRSGSVGNEVPHQIEVGQLVFGPSCPEPIEATGDFGKQQSNCKPQASFIIPTLFEIVNDLRLHTSMKLTKDIFKGVTVQFSDHYYKFDLSKGDITTVRKIRMHSPTV